MYNKKVSRLLMFMLTFLLVFSNIAYASNINIAKADISREQFTKVRDLKVHYINVGQGDSIFIELPDGKNALIDGGTASAGNTVVNYLKSNGTTKLDYVFGTHPHEDHIGGLIPVLNNFEVETIYLPDRTHTTKTFENLLLTIRSKNINAQIAGNDTTIIDKPGLALKSFGPNNPKSNNLNNSSIVLKLHSFGHNFLFTGDAELESEIALINSGKNLKVDVLKVGHHGSNTSTSPQFLKATNPKYGVISVGPNNSYGHPTQDVLSRLQSNGTQILRTDTDGTIVITSNGQNLSISKNGVVINNNTPNVKNPTPKPVVKPVTKPKPKPVIKPAPKEPVQQQVLVTPTGKKYHARKCGRGNYSWTTLKKAKARGLTPCSKCF